MYVLGQINNRFKELSEKIEEIDFFDEKIISCGNFELYDYQVSRVNPEIIRLNDNLRKKENTLFIIRGNHDNPNLFSKTQNLLSNIVVLRDFSIINGNILCFGGGISADRIDRNKHGLYWENESVYYPFNKVDEFFGVNIIITHKPPPYVFDGILENFIDFWVKGDACLENQLSKERDESQRFINQIRKTNKIGIIISSNLNISADKTQDGIKFISLKELEIIKLL